MPPSYRAGQQFYDAAVDALDRQGQAGDLTLKLDTYLERWVTGIETGQIEDLKALAQKAEAQFVGRQTEDGLDTLPTRAAEADRSTLIADIPFPAPGNVAAKRVRERKTSVLRACRVPNPAKRLNVVQGPKPLFEPQRSMTSRS